MGITQVHNSVWTPDGEHPFREKDVLPLTRVELVTLSHLHEFAQKHQITIVCKRCNSAIVGKNNDAEIRAGQQPSVACQCREWRYHP